MSKFMSLPLISCQGSTLVEAEKGCQAGVCGHVHPGQLARGDLKGLQEASYTHCKEALSPNLMTEALLFVSKQKEKARSEILYFLFPSIIFMNG